MENTSYSRTITFSFVMGCILVLLATVCPAENPAAPPFVELEAEVAPGTADQVTLATALAWALERNPRLAAFSWEIRAAEARELQAGLRPNPELLFEAENVGVGGGPASRSVETAAALDWEDGTPTPSAARTWQRESGAPSGFAEAEFTLSLSQLIELGGKRAQRLRVAARDRDVAAWDYEIARASVLAETARAFCRVVSAQQQIVIAEELVALAKRFQETIRALAEAGKVSPLEEQRFNPELAAAQILLENARHEREAARRALAAMWDDEEPRFGRAEGSLAPISELPALDSLRARIDANPDLKRWMAEFERREAVIELEQSNAMPDLTLEFGVRIQGTEPRNSSTFELATSGVAYSRGRWRPDSDWDTSLVFGASLPLPIFNRNQGNIREAQALACAGAELHRQERLSAATALSEAYHEAAKRFGELRALENEIIPSADKVFSLTEEGYRQGKFSYLDVLDTERTLAEARIRREAALLEYHRNRITIERLTGGAIEENPIAATPAE